MPLLIPFDPSGLEPKTVNALDEIIAALQTWGGKLDSYGRWNDVAYDSSFYVAVAGVWTVGRLSHRRFRYAMSGPETMDLQVVLATTTTSAGIGNDLRIQLPTGYQLKPNASGIQDSYNMVGMCQYNAGAVSGTGHVWAGDQNKAPTQLRLLRDELSPSTNWPAGVTDLTISFNVRIPVVAI